jgi:hypothetical protein
MTPFSSKPTSPGAGGHGSESDASSTALSVAGTRAGFGTGGEKERERLVGGGDKARVVSGESSWYGAKFIVVDRLGGAEAARSLTRSLRRA